MTEAAGLRQKVLRKKQKKTEKEIPAGRYPAGIFIGRNQVRFRKSMPAMGSVMQVMMNKGRMSMRTS